MNLPTNGLKIGFVFLASCTGEGWPDPPALTQAEFEAQHLEWSQSRRDGLVTPPGGAVLWVGLWELSEGATAFGADSSLSIVLPAEDSPPMAGLLHREGDQVRLEPAAGARIHIREGPRIEEPLLLIDDRSPDRTFFTLGSLGMRLHAERGTDRLWLRVWDEDSPKRETFALPESFPLDARWRVAARFDPFAEPRELPVADVTGGMVTNRVPGELVFRIQGQEHRLLASADTNSTTYFIMLWDSTALSTTYEAGRYLRAPIADSTGWTTLDFNRAYNPSCVFSPYSVCGLPPRENRLEFPVTAGEKRRIDP